jgi:hypothetical protein
MGDGISPTRVNTGFAFLHTVVLRISNRIKKSSNARDNIRILDRIVLSMKGKGQRDYLLLGFNCSPEFRTRDKVLD